MKTDQEIASQIQEWSSVGILQGDYYDHYIPAEMIPGLAKYIANRETPNHFLRLVLIGDLHNAVYANYEDREYLSSYTLWLDKYAPPECWGSEEKVTNWLFPTIRRQDANLRGLSKEFECLYCDVYPEDCNKFTQEEA